MSHDLSQLTQSFVEDCREHLESIEASLLDIEAAGDDRDPELLNGVFRLAHSIKGGAGMLGFDNIKALAHKLENVLHKMRSGELRSSRSLLDALLNGFDRLSFLVGNIHESEHLDIAPQVEQLLALVGEPDDAVMPAGGFAALAVGKGGTFDVDAESLRQAAAGGNEIYLLEFDLIHDIHGKGRMPLEVLKALTDTGRIVDCKVDFCTVGDLDDFTNSIPFYVLFASILESQYVAGLVKLPHDRVRHMDVGSLALISREPGADEKRYGALALRPAGGLATICLPETLSPPVLTDLRNALEAGMADCEGVLLDWTAVVRADLLFFQLLHCAKRSFQNRGRALAAVSPLPQDLVRICASHGFAQAESGALLPLRRLD